MSDQASSTGSGKPWGKSLLAIVAAANLAAGAIGGALLTDFTGFREKQTEAAIAAVAAARDADQELNPLLVKFAKLALGEGSVNQEDRLEFDKIINKADQKAATIKQIYPDTKGFYEEYSNSLIALKQSADKLKGPYTGKEFVKAVDKYAVSRDEFQEAAQRAGSGYLRSFKM